MSRDVFNIENFNIISDDENYYFFRALNNRDNNDINNGITTDTNGNIIRVRTDRQTYEGETKYSKEDTLTLEEIFDHIKMHHRTDTNCISLTTNANVAILYGREYYKDKYIMVKVPKKDLGKTVVNAGQYMIDETNRRINKLLQTNEISDEIKFYIQAIDLTTTKQELSKLIKDITKEEPILTDSMFKKGIDYNKNITITVDYQALTKEQNLEKDKVVEKLNIIGKNILPRTSNKFLIQTIGTAFSSLELIHYNEITKEELIEVPKELIDIFALLQQMPTSNEKVEQLKRELLTKILTKDYNIEEFSYSNYELNTEEDYTIEKMYELTNGDVDYYQAINLYKKSFYLSKSKLRTKSMIDLLNKIIDNTPEYQDIIEELERKTYGVEYKIFSKTNSNKLQVSQSVNLDFSKKEKELFNFVNNLTTSDLNYIIKKPLEAVKFYLDNFKSIEHRYMSKEDYYANAIIDLFDWSKFNISKIYPEQRQEIIKKLKEKHIIELYDFLKLNNVKEENIANALLTIAIKDKELKTVDFEDDFTLEELEDFLGYYQIKDTEELKLRDYQAQALRNIDAAFQKHNYTSVILPTGAGKSFVALSEMLEHKDKKILYLAPNNEILSQLSRYTKNFITGSAGTSGLSNIKILQRKFKNITTATYSKLTEESAKEILEEKYDLIIFDELHRTGAEEWNKYVKELIDNQTKDVKVLGITATPQRDMDLSNMTDYWAKHFGYTEEEISKQKHISTNMDLEEGIKSKYVVNPKLVTCEYSLLKDGKLENLQEKINNIPDEQQKQELKLEYEKLRRNVEKSNGIEQILEEHLKNDGRYIVFLPITKKDNEIYEDEDGNQISNSKAERIIQAYQTQMRQYIYAGNYLKEHATTLDEINTKLQNEEELSLEEVHYLYKQKKNILLLSKVSNITKTNNILVTYVNEIADNIIKYMDWKPLSFGEQGKLLREKTNDLVDCYSMLGSYTDTKNVAELSNFSSTESDKLKFMFVMNKLNEGVHIDNIDGIIWLRALDENSKILYLQQLGRCIFGLDSNKPLPEEKRPLVIDLVNNTLTVKLDKGDIPEIKDLNLIRIIENYLESNQKLDLDINSNNKTEHYYAITLKRIQSKYHKYLDNFNILNDLEYKKQRAIEEILSIGYNLDLWNKDFNMTNTSEPKNKTNTESAFSLYEGFQLTGIIQDFYNLTKEVNVELHINSEEKKEELIKSIRELKRLPKSKNKNEGISEKKFRDGTDQRTYFDNMQTKYHNIDFSKELTETELEVTKDYKEIMEVLNEFVITMTSEKKEELIKSIKELKRLPKKKGNNKRISEKTFRDGTDQRNYFDVLQTKYHTIDFSKELTETELEVTKDYKEIMGVLNKFVITMTSEKKEELIKSIKELGRLPKVKVNNEGISEKTFRDGTDQRTYFDNLQIKYNTIDFSKELTETELEVTKDYKEIIETLNQIVITIPPEEKKQELIKSIKELKRLPKQKNKKAGIPEKTFRDGKNQRNYYDELQKKYNKIDLSKKLTETELEVIKDYEEIMEVLNQYVLIITPKEKKQELIKSIQELNRLPKTKASNERISEKTFRDGTDQREYFNTLQKKYNKIDLSKKLTETELEVIKDYEEIIRAKENIERIINLSNLYNIDIKVNKSILNKSYEEVYAKICYLKESKQDKTEQRDMSITNDGKLHEIFFMSDLNMQIKYGISLDALMNKYINESTRGI